MTRLDQSEITAKFAKYIETVRDQIPSATPEALRQAVDALSKYFKIEDYPAVMTIALSPERLALIRSLGVSAAAANEEGYAILARAARDLAVLVYQSAVRDDPEIRAEADVILNLTRHLPRP